VAARVDATEGQTDVWQAALALMRFTHGYLIICRTPRTSTRICATSSCNAAASARITRIFLIGLCRSVKIPAALCQRLSGHGNRQRDARVAEVFIPGLGWRALDPTHNCQIGETYVKIGHGRDTPTCRP